MTRMSTSRPDPRGPTAGTLLWLASTGGRADRVRIALTGVGAALGTLALLAAATVIATGPGDGDYTAEVIAQQGLHPGVVVALLLLCIPLMLFVGQCSRIGAPARDRRLALMRMVGATPVDATRIAALETGIAALAGAVVGCAGSFVLRVILDDGHQAVATRTVTTDLGGGASEVSQYTVTTIVRSVPTNVIPPVWVIAALTLVIPVLAVLTALLALRRVTVSPFGVVRRDETRVPRILPVVLYGVGVAGFLAWEALARWLRLADRGLGVGAGLALGLTVLTVTGLVLGGAATASAAGRILAGRTGTVSVLIAARRMVAAPYSASRQVTAVVVAVFIGAAVQGTRTAFLLMTDPDDPFYRQTFDLVDSVLVVGLAIGLAALLVVAAESVVSRRRTLAALTAAGTPRTVLARAIVFESILPLIPMVAAAALAGDLAARGLWGSKIRVADYNPTSTSTEPAEHVVTVPIPWSALTVLTVGTIAAAAVMTCLSLVFLRRSTSLTELRST